MPDHNTFPERVAKTGGVPIMFETIPPRRDASDQKVHAWREEIVRGLEPLPVMAINIPEVRDETRKGERTYSFERRIKPREFGRSLRETFAREINLVTNRVVVHRPVAQQREWLENSHRDWGLRNLVLVGGESDRVSYPGPSVTCAARLITREINPDLPEGERWFCGGICIPTRRHSDPKQDEPARLVNKQQNGIEFFTTQIICEAESFLQLLKDYSAVCEAAGLEAKRIFVSLAPVGRVKHVEFLRWLGVDVPKEVETELLRQDEDVGTRSLDVCCRIFEQIHDFNASLKRPIPLGLNISPLMRSNFELAFELVRRLA